MNEMKGILLPGEPREVDPELPKSAMMLFAPVDKRAFGVAIGAAAAAVRGLALFSSFILPPSSFDDDFAMTVSCGP